MPARKQNQNSNVEAEIVKQKHKRPLRTEEYLPHYEPGEMSAMIQQALNLSSFGEVDTNNPDAVNERIMQYFAYCVKNDIKPSAEGMALSLNTTRTTLWRWREGSESNKPEGVRNAIKKGYSILNYLLTQTMQNGSINPVSAIFLLKNNYQYVDKSEVMITPNNPYDTQSDEELSGKYLTGSVKAE